MKRVQMVAVLKVTDNGRQPLSFEKVKGKEISIVKSRCRAVWTGYTYNMQAVAQRYLTTVYSQSVSIY